MTPLQVQLQRLYLPHPTPQAGAPAEGAGLIAPDGTVRGLVLELAQPADWDALSVLWRGVQADLELPAPAIAVNGVDGYQLWFSLAQAVPVADALVFLEALRVRYLGDVPSRCVRLMPSIAALVPALRDTSRWSAFVAPDLAAIFGDDPWLDLPPNPEAQSQVLSRLACIPSAAFRSALARIAPAGAAPSTAVRSANSGVALLGVPPAAAPGAVASSTAEYAQSPRRFLLDVMADTRVDLHLRIEAAKALLPYCDGPGGT